MRFIICLHSDRERRGRATVTLERSREETPGCVFNVDSRIITKGKITIFTQGEIGGEKGLKFPEEGFHAESGTNIGENEVLEFIQEQYSKIGCNEFPESIRTIVRFLYGSDAECDKQCPGRHYKREDYERAAAARGRFNKLVHEYSRDISEKLGGGREAVRERDTEIKPILCAFVLAILAAVNPTGVDASRDIVDYSFNNFGLGQELLDNGIYGNEQGLHSGLPDGGYSSNPMVLVRYPEVCDSKSAEEKCFDDAQSCSNFWRTCLRMGEGGIVPDRKMSLGVHVHSPMEQFAQIGSGDFSDHISGNLRSEASDNDCDEMGKCGNESDITSIGNCFSVLAIVLALVIREKPSFFILASLLTGSIASMEQSNSFPLDSEKIGLNELNETTTIADTTTMTTVMSTTGDDRTTPNSTRVVTPEPWTEVLHRELYANIEVDKYVTYSLNGKKVEMIDSFYEMASYVFSDSWRGNISARYDQTKIGSSRTCENYECSVYMSDQSPVCNITVPESSLHLNNKTYYLSSKPFESGFVSTVSDNRNNYYMGVVYGLKSLISCSHNQDIYGTIDTKICAFKDVKINGVVWELCVYSCDICEVTGGYKLHSIDLSVQNTPNILPEAVKVFNCTTDLRLNTNQKICRTNIRTDELDVELGNDVTRFVVNDDNEAICQWNDSPNVNIRTCWCRQMKVIYITDCRSLGETVNKRAWKAGKLGSIYLYENGHEWRIVKGKYVSVSPRSEEVVYRTIDAIGFGFAAKNYITEYGLISARERIEKGSLTKEKIEISLVRPLGSQLISSDKVGDSTTLSRFMPTSKYDPDQVKIMSLLTENSKNLTIYDGSGIFWYGSMKGCGGYGPETFCTNNVLQECKLHDSKTIRNVCMLLGSSPSRNTWLAAVYILAGYLCFGGMSQLFHIGRYIMYLFKKKKPYYRKMIYLQSYCLSWCYGNDLDLVHQALSTGRKSHKLMTYLNSKGSLTSLKSKGEYEWTEDVDEEMSEEEMYKELNLLDNSPRFTVGNNFVRKKMRFIIFWLPQWMYLAVLLQFAWSLLTFWNIGAYYWYITKREKKLHDTLDNDYEPLGSEEEKQAILDSSRTKSLKQDANTTTVIVQKKKLKKRFNPKSETLLKILGIVFWLMIGRVECVTQTYVISCDDGNCERAIDIDEPVMLTNGSTLQIDLRNPDSGDVDGMILFTLKSLDMKVKGTYDFSVVQSKILHYECLSDGSDCDGDCSTPFSALKADDFGREIQSITVEQFANLGPYTWSNKEETTGLNHGYCVGMTAIEPQWSSDIARTFRLTETETLATITMRMITDSEDITEEFVTQMNGKTFNFGSDNKVQFSEEKNHFAKLSNERIICFFEAGKFETVLRDCSIGASGIDMGYALKTVGEGPDGYTSWRSPIVNAHFSNEDVMCNDCNMGGSCKCDCRHKWSTSLLERFNREDIKGMGSIEPPNDCITEIEMTELEESEPEFRCLDWETTDESECKKMCPSRIDSCWVEKTVRKPRSIDIRSTGCSSGQFGIKAAIKSRYDSSVFNNIVSSPDIDVSGTGCWGNVYGYQISYTSQKQGLLYLSSETLQVPGVVSISELQGKFNGTAALDLDQFYFHILDEDGTSSLITVAGGLDECDGIVDGGNGEQGGADIDTGLAGKSWIYWLIAILSVLLAVLILICLLKLLTRKGSSNPRIVEKSKAE